MYKKHKKKEKIFIKNNLRIREIFNVDEKDIEEKLQEVFVIFLTEKLAKTENIKDDDNSKKDVVNSDGKVYNYNSWIRGTYCYQKEEKI